MGRPPHSGNPARGLCRFHPPLICSSLPAMTDSPPANSPDSFPAAPRPSATEALDRLLAIMARLRDPDGGCPWDLQQNFATIAPYPLEIGNASCRERVCQSV